MNSVYPINSHPWNTFAVNAGLIDTLAGIAIGLGGVDATMSSEIALSGSATGVGTMAGVPYITAPFAVGSATGVGTVQADPVYFYYGGYPIIVTNWNEEEPISPEYIKLVNWDNI